MRTSSSHACAGLTLVELMLALGLFAILGVGLLRFLDDTLELLREAEADRELLAQRTALFDWLFDDLERIAAGTNGDLLVDWEVFDTDGDGIAGRPWPRLRLVREAGPDDLVRLGRREAVDAAGEIGRPAGGQDRPLVEVVWAVLPRSGGPAQPGEPGRRGDGVLLRGERSAGDAGRSFFDPAFFSGGGQPQGEVDELCAGVLWFEIQCATQTSVVHEAWDAGVDMQDAARAWDGRGLGRPHVARHPWNERHRFLPVADGDGLAEPLLPRRVRIELELEREEDARRRTRLRVPVTPESTVIEVERPERVPGPGSMILVGEEWMRVTSSHSEEIFVQRGLRGTRVASHRVGTPIQHGTPYARELALPLAREEWKP